VQDESTDRKKEVRVHKDVESTKMMMTLHPRDIFLSHLAWRLLGNMNIRQGESMQ
jgi:hypothetical protein